MDVLCVTSNTLQGKYLQGKVKVGASMFVNNEDITRYYYLLFYMNISTNNLRLRCIVYNNFFFN